MNGYKEGYNAGFSDAKNRKSKNYNRHMPKLKAVMSANFVDTFIEGYNEGYKQAMVR